ncbi:hypothetical protein [Kordia sp.]|uniref:hypothetical protein n=1 Tax=Kordia sp. TaxID=1965332 RepID=UPI0025C6A51D|nr:hypothetical protein [Kordia sp.]MCH2194045.1 hypothetical protein [Kordia sp.]
MMKKLLYIFGFLLCISCNQFSSKSENAPSPTEDSNSYRYTIDKDRFDGNGLSDLDDKLNSESFKFSTSNFDVKDLNAEISTKLQDNYEAQLLATKHPEFAETIKEQLADSNKFNTALSDSIKTIAIEDLKFSGEMQSQNDSIITQKIYYTSLINSKYKQKDSVLVVIKRATILIDGAIKVNTSFSFEGLDH